MGTSNIFKYLHRIGYREKSLLQCVACCRRKPLRTQEFQVEPAASAGESSTDLRLGERENVDRVGGDDGDALLAVFAFVGHRVGVCVFR